ncbi:MAG: signal recognition particle-docking protein FtsY [Desulfurococcales archaeon]|nr:signal recognition particle-docking protein FtsY [Desulfurococcales archaeon]
MVFDRLRRAVSKTASLIKTSVGEKIAYKEIKEDDIADVLDELLMALIEADVAYEVAEKIVEHVKNRLVGAKVKRGEDIDRIVKEAFREKLLEILDIEVPDLLDMAQAQRSRPIVVLFLGVNGVGKTTTIAKIAYMLKNNGITPVLAAADTFRAGAQEQLAKHAERIGVPIIRGRYGSDPASVAHDAISHAVSKGYRIVLVDTAGRMHVDYDLMGELRKIVRVTKPDLKILVVDSLTGNDAVEQAKIFNEEIGVDGVILTKTDADVKGGTAVSVVYTIKKPILYIGTGQDYGDIEKFDAKKYVETIVG